MPVQWQDVPLRGERAHVSMQTWAAGSFVAAARCPQNNPTQLREPSCARTAEFYSIKGALEEPGGWSGTYLLFPRPPRSSP